MIATKLNCLNCSPTSFLLNPRLRLFYSNVFTYSKLPCTGKKLLCGHENSLYINNIKVFSVKLNRSAQYSCFSGHGKQTTDAACSLSKYCLNINQRYFFGGNLRGLHSNNRRQRMLQSRRSVVLYIAAAGVFMLGMSYAGVPLYRMFCQATGLGGLASTAKGHDSSKVESMKPVKNRIIKVKFNADVASSMRWNFKPQQSDVKVVPGETALAFYTARNPTDKPVIGISTYNVVPFEAGQYFNKIQCFCFEEQRLNPHEQVDMPVFFYIDPEFDDDPKLEGVETITLSYTFFEAKEGFRVPLPGYMTQ